MEFKARAQRFDISCNAYIAVMHKLDCLTERAVQWCELHKTETSLLAPRHQNRTSVQSDSTAYLSSRYTRTPPFSGLSQGTQVAPSISLRHYPVKTISNFYIFKYHLTFSSFTYYRDRYTALESKLYSLYSIFSLMYYTEILLINVVDLILFSL